MEELGKVRKNSHLIRKLEKPNICMFRGRKRIQLYQNHNLKSC